MNDPAKKTTEHLHRTMDALRRQDAWHLCSACPVRRDRAFFLGVLAGLFLCVAYFRRSSNLKSQI